MTKQEALNIVWQHFVIEKGLPSYYPDKDSCLYRGPDGAKCAVGLLIPDDEYTSDFEGYSVAHIVAAVPALQDMANKDDIAFLEELQECHDYAATETTEPNPTFHEEVEHRLERLAMKWNLEVPKL